VKSYNDKWQDGKTFKACGKTEAEAHQKLKEQIDSFLANVVDNELKQLHAEIVRKNIEVHGSEGESVKPLDCSVCP